MLPSESETKGMKIDLPPITGIENTMHFVKNVFNSVKNKKN